jgi:tol-pal system protein YbgF
MKHCSVQFAAVLAVCSVFILNGCIATATDVNKMQYKLNTLGQDIDQIKKKSRNIETQIPGQKKALNKKLQEIAEAQKATAETVSDLLMQNQSLTSEFQVLTGRFEEARYFSEKSSTELLDSKEELITKLKELQLELSDLKQKVTQTEAEIKIIKEFRARKEVKKPKKIEKKKTAPAPPKDDSKKTEIKNIYLAAYQAYKGGKTEAARKKFSSLLKKYSENEYSDNARFWIGESYYKDGNFEEAILAYEELFKENPKSDKIPGAMLKQGLAFYSLKDQKTGKIILEKLIEKHPGSEQANLAKKKMKKTVVPPKKN